MRDNPLTARLLGGGHAFGVMAFEFFTTGLPAIVRSAGAEFLLLDMEHSGVGFETVKAQIAPCRGIDLVPMARVSPAEYHFIARLLDLGAMGVMVPMVETAEQAAFNRRLHALSAARSPRVGPSAWLRTTTTPRAMSFPR